MCEPSTMKKLGISSEQKANKRKAPEDDFEDPFGDDNYFNFEPRDVGNKIIIDQNGNPVVVRPEQLKQ